MGSTTTALGRLERVELREVWTTEAEGFTPWLAAEESIALLGDAIGLDLEVEAQEKNVGPFRADILCKETRTGDWVLVENQLEKTDHIHLGQLITYAAGLKAVTIVWVARRFTDEHRAAIDWLNDITGEHFQFFALEVEAWRIGNSLPAPKFNVVSQPNDWSREVAGGVSRVVNKELSVVQQLQLEFWTGFRIFVEENPRRFRPTKPLPQHWLNFAIGRTGFELSAVASTWNSATGGYDGGELRAELTIKHAELEACFAELRQEREGIDELLGEPAEWYSAEGVLARRVFLRCSANLEDRGSWPRYFEWLSQRIDKLDEIFRPRIKALDLEAFARERGEESGDH